MRLTVRMMATQPTDNQDSDTEEQSQRETDS